MIRCENPDRSRCVRIFRGMAPSSPAMRGARTAVLLVLAATIPGIRAGAPVAVAPKPRISPALDFAMGAVSGCTASLMVFPIDLAKTRSFPDSSLPIYHPPSYALLDLHPSRDYSKNAHETSIPARPGSRTSESSRAWLLSTLRSRR